MSPLRIRPVRPARRYGRGYDAGPDCATCGMKAINVVHDDPITRARNIESWAAPSPSMDGKDYYTWADITYHPFAPGATVGNRPDVATPRVAKATRGAKGAR